MDRHHQKPALVIISGPTDSQMEDLGRTMEQYLLNTGRLAYYLGLSNLFLGLDADLKQAGGREEFLRRLGEIAHLFTDAGAILLTTVTDLDDFELELVQMLASPGTTLLVSVGPAHISQHTPDLVIDKIDLNSLNALHQLLCEKKFLPDYQI